MSAEKLRAAAALLRVRAEAATAAPWWNDRACHNVIFSGTGLADDIAVTEDFDKRVDAEYIATMHPGVGLALANWLDDSARGHDMWAEMKDTDHADRILIHAIRVADHILGGTA